MKKDGWLPSVDSSCVTLFAHIKTNGNREASLIQNNPYHCVLIIDFNDNNWRVISQLAGLSKQLHILKDQQLVPCRAQGLWQHLEKNPKTFDKDAGAINQKPDS